MNDNSHRAGKISVHGNGLGAPDAGRAADFVMTTRCLGREGLGRIQDRSAFLIQRFLVRLDHLVVGRFLDPVLDEVLADVLLVFHSGRPMAGR